MNAGRGRGPSLCNCHSHDSFSRYSFTVPDLNENLRVEDFTIKEFPGLVE